MKIEQEQTLQKIRDERHRQDVKWGGSGHDDAQPLSHFLEAIDQKVCNLVVLDLVDEDPAETERRLVQIAALAVAAAESIQRKTRNRSAVSWIGARQAYSTHPVC